MIDSETFERAQKLMTDRTTHHAETPLNLKGQSLLAGNIYCGHCRNRLTLTTSGRKRVNREGEVVREVRSRYQCHYNVRHPGECDGQSGYGVKKLDGIIDRIVRYQLSKICADLYDTCSFAAKKMIISQFIKAVHVYRDYILEIEFNVSFEDFKAMATECHDQGPHEQPKVYIAA